MANNYDIIIAGLGVAGVFAAHELSKLSKGLKIVAIDFGKRPMKRRRQLEGWLGCFPTSNTQLYYNNVSSVGNIVGLDLAEKKYTETINILKKYGPTKYTNCKLPSEGAQQRAKRLSYKLDTDNEYIQWHPENVHLFSKHISEEIISDEKIELVFDNEIRDISKVGDDFILQTEFEEYRGKKLLLCLGRSGFRFSKKIFEKLEMIQADDYAHFGFYGEIPSCYMKEWSGSHCILTRKNLSIGPLSWGGTVIPEDHCDLVTSAWRSNEERWKTDKVAFSVIINDRQKNIGCFQTERLSKLAYVLSDNRVGKKKVSEYISSSNTFELTLVPEYAWMKTKIKEINDLFPNFIAKGSFYVPAISPQIPKINIKKNLSTDVDGLFLAGESAGLFGILSAAISGKIAGANILKGI